jgi:ketosteroid isomerase-like protein
VSEANLDLVRKGYESFAATGRFAAQFAVEDFTWDMSKFSGWPEQQVYEGPQEADRFLREWTEAWEDWKLEVDSLHDAGERVVAVMRQGGRSRTTGMEVDMSFAQVWSIKNGQMVRMDMYAHAAEAMRAVGLDASVLD